MLLDQPESNKNVVSMGESEHDQVKVTVKRAWMADVELNHTF